MEHKFKINGSDAEDNVLYPWALGALGRALIFYSEAHRSKNSRLIRGIAAYYSLFHLSMALLFLNASHLSIKQREKINKALNAGLDDPSPALHHKMVNQFIKNCVNRGLPKSFWNSLTKAYNLRTFLNYGPRIRLYPAIIKVDTCEFNCTEADKLISELEVLFRQAVYWASKESTDGGIWLGRAVEEVEDFFKKPDYYQKWVEIDVLKKASVLRKSLSCLISRSKK